MPQFQDSRIWGPTVVWGGREDLTSSRRRIAAGAWFLAAGLLVGTGGATAFADCGSGATKHTRSSSAAERRAASTASGTGHGATTVARGQMRSEHVHATTNHRIRHKPARNSPTDRSEPDTKPTTRITRNVTEAVGARQVSADSALTADSAFTTDAASTDGDTAPTSDPTPPTDTAPTGEVASPPTTNEPQPFPTDSPPTDDPPTPANDASASGSDQVPSASNAEASDPTTLPTAPNAGQQDAGEGDPSSSDTAASADEQASIPEQPITSTTDPVAPLTPLPAEVASPPADPTVEVPLVTDDVSGRGRSGARGAPALSPLQILRLMTQASGSPFTGKATEIPTLLDGSSQRRSGSSASSFDANTALVGKSSTSLASRVEPGAVLPGAVQTFLHSYGQVIVVASLSAMFAVALPGLAGLVIPTMMGMHIGYRQAKAARALRTSGIAQLAASAPIGVVRSGSLVALRPSRRPPPPPPSIEDLAQNVA